MDEHCSRHCGTVCRATVRAECEVMVSGQHSQVSSLYTENLDSDPVIMP